MPRLRIDAAIRAAYGAPDPFPLVHEYMHFDAVEGGHALKHNPKGRT